MCEIRSSPFCHERSCYEENNTFYVYCNRVGVIICDETSFFTLPHQLCNVVQMYNCTLPLCLSDDITGTVGYKGTIVHTVTEERQKIISNVTVCQNMN